MIKNVTIETEHGSIDVAVEIEPGYYVVKVSRDLVESAPLRDLSWVISRAMRAVWAGGGNAV